MVVLTADVDEGVIVVVITVPIEIVEMGVTSVTSAVAPAVAAIPPAVVATSSVAPAVVATSSVACISARIILVLFEFSLLKRASSSARASPKLSSAILSQDFVCLYMVVRME